MLVGDVMYDGFLHEAKHAGKDAAFAVALFLIMSVGPLVTGLMRLFGAPDPTHSRLSAIPLLAFSLLTGALTGFLVLWAAQQAG